MHYVYSVNMVCYNLFVNLKNIEDGIDGKRKISPWNIKAGND